MKLLKYECDVHAPTNYEPAHVDVALYFEGKDPIKMCDCSAYLGGMDSYGYAEQMVAAVREDLDQMANNATEYDVAIDAMDGSLDIVRTADRALMFSMECEHMEGADWVPQYNN